MDISRRVSSYFELAKRISWQSDHDIFWHGSVLVKHGRVINAAPNKTSHSSFAGRFLTPDKKYPTRHSEINVILGLSREQTSGADVYVVRVNNLGQYKMSRPCLMCQETLRFVGVKRVFYSVDNGSFEVMKI